MSANGVLLSTVSLLLIILYVVGQTLPRKQFKKVTTCNGTVMCADDRPFTVLTFLSDQLVINGGACISATVLCARACTQETQCIGYNYREDSLRCEMYDIIPKTASSQPGCSHFRVGPRNKCTTIVPLSF